MVKIMVVDDEKEIRDTMQMILEYEDYEVVLAANGREALTLFGEHDIDVVFLDIKMPGMDGMEVLEKMKSLQHDVAVVMISGHGDIQTAVEATKKGAYDFLPKPLDQDRILITIRNSLSQKRLTRENKELHWKLSGPILGHSAAMQRIFETVERVAPTDAGVLITGENGSGKELIARSIHYLSRRVQGPFVDVNCAAIPSELIESELFGHERGAFTGAQAKRRGKFEQAQQGTIFLDEVGDMSLAAQAKVLRVLQEKKIERVGGNKAILIDVRVIAATNKDLAHEVKQGRFRQDLFYRLNVVPIHLPPLRERREDIPELVSHFIKECAEQNAVPTKKITEAAVRELQAHDWPGNVRELRNLIERLVILCPDSVIDWEDIRNFLAPAHPTKMDDLFASCHTFEDFKRESEKLFLRHRLITNGWNVKKTAEELQMQRSNLYKKMEKYGLMKPR